MHIWTDLSEVPTGTRSVVTIGNFDGLHRGHAKVIEATVERAKKAGVMSVALTFDPHPRTVHVPDNPVPLIMSLETRLEALETTGLGAVLVVHYEPSLYKLTPEEFVCKYLVELLGVNEVVVGEDFRFGAGNSGSVTTLIDLGKKYDFSVMAVTDLVCHSGRRWSSSWVRELLAEGNVEEAAHVLGRPYRLVGEVQHGAKRGRTLGFPTANLEAGEDVLAPADGVYAGWVVRDVPGSRAQEFLPAAISVGTNPQFDGKQRTIEAHVLGRNDLNLYSQQIAVVFISFLRPMLKFDSLEQLLEQMDEDLRNAAVTLGVRAACRVADFTTQ